MSKTYLALGLMSGTSLDGIDVALIETDGQSHVAAQGFKFFPYNDAFRERLRTSFGKREGAVDLAIKQIEQELTRLHANAVKDFLIQEKVDPSSIDLIGFHGQTIWHNPAARETVQLGDGAMLAQLTGIDVVNDFRSADVKAGGQGAPLVPLYHRALAAALPRPIAIVNIGGVSNVTWIGGAGEDDILAFDMGTGNALLDDWVLRHTGQPYDKNGALAAQGRVDEARVAAFMAHPFFAQKPPKSLDRDAFKELEVENFTNNSISKNSSSPRRRGSSGLGGILDFLRLWMPAFAGMTKKVGEGVFNGAATLTMMTVQAITQGLEHMPQKPNTLYVTGGGRHNATMMRWLAEATGVVIKSVDELGWDGDALEAQAFAYLAVRSVLGLPLSLPTTTGVAQPMTGGTVHRSA